MRTVSARFEGNPQKYSYYVPKGEEPEIGDFILTSVSWDEAQYTGGDVRLDSMISRAKIAKIVAIDEEPSSAATKFYLKLIPVEELRRMRDVNREMLKTHRTKATAKKRLEALLRKEDDLVKYERIAASNPEAAKLLEILKGDGDV